MNQYQGGKKAKFGKLDQVRSQIIMDLEQKIGNIWNLGGKEENNGYWESGYNGKQD